MLDTPGTTSEKRSIARTRFSNAGEEILSKKVLALLQMQASIYDGSPALLLRFDYTFPTFHNPSLPIAPSMIYFSTLSTLLSPAEICLRALLSLKDRMGVANGTVIENGINEVKQVKQVKLQSVSKPRR